MKYCGECGQLLTRRWIATDQRDREVCGCCGTIHYHNPKIVVCGIVTYREKVLMCRRAHPPAMGQWTVPSGFLECGETLEEGVARETLEETGIGIGPERYELSSVINMQAIQQVAIAFRTHLNKLPSIIPGPECQEVAFLGEDEIPLKEIAWRDSMGDGPQRFFNELRAARFTIQLVSMGNANGAGYKARDYVLESINADRTS